MPENKLFTINRDSISDPLTKQQPDSQVLKAHSPKYDGCLAASTVPETTKQQTIESFNALPLLSDIRYEQSPRIAWQVLLGDCNES